MALYPRFDHHAGVFRLLAAVFTRGAVPVPTPSPQSPSSNTSQRKIAPLPRPLKRPSAKVATAMDVVPNGAPADASSLLNVGRPFGDGIDGSGKVADIGNDSWSSLTFRSSSSTSTTNTTSSGSGASSRGTTTSDDV